MRDYKRPLAIATAVLALPLFALAQNSNTQNQNTNATNQSQSMSSHHTGRREAQRMVPANAELLHNLDAKDMHPGYAFKAKLSKDVKLDDGMKLDSGTILYGRVEQDDMQTQGMSKLALRFTRAELKDGKVVPIKATIVGIFKPQSTNFEGYPVAPGNQVPNSWNDGTLQVDQLNVMPGVDLHSSINSRNSGVFVSKTKDNVKLDTGSEIQLAVAGRGGNRNTATSGGV